jgi:hypothetical protein
MSGAQFDDPNRESVGLAPIWEGAGDVPNPTAEPEQAGRFDPGEHTVTDVEAYLADHPDERDAVLDAERAGKARVSLVGDE